jgi:N-acetylglucosaminyl-diphospho-decaprenol L-rhamnosyltransferase
MNELTVQIVNYHTKAYLQPCLASLIAAFASTPIEHRILVLDNASGEDLSDLAGGSSDRVAIHVSDVNRGFGGGHNYLAAQDASALLCFVNPDTVLRHPDGLHRLMGLFADPAVVAAGPGLRDSSGAPQRWDHGELAGLRARIANGAGHAHWRPRRSRIDAAWVSGAFMMVRRDRFASVGGFDESFFLYKEDEDLCLRLRATGGRVVYEPAVVVEHVGSVVAKRDERYLQESNARFRAKHFSDERRRRLLETLYLNVSRRI